MTGATFTTMRLRTLRGMATVPAWRLRFADLPGTIDQVAIDWDALGRLEDLIGDRIGCPARASSGSTGRWATGWC